MKTKRDEVILHSEPRELGVDVKVPALFKDVLEPRPARWYHRLFRIPPGFYRHANRYGTRLTVTVMVEWPDGSLSFRSETIRGKTLSPYVRAITLRRS